MATTVILRLSHCSLNVFNMVLLSKGSPADGELFPLPGADSWALILLPSKLLFIPQNPNYKLPSLGIFFFLLYLFINSCENLLLILVLSVQFKHFSEFTHHILIEWASPVAAVQEIWVRSLGQEDAPGEGNGYPLQFSFLENSMDRGAWRAIVHGVAKSWSVLSD